MGAARRKSLIGSGGTTGACGGIGVRKKHDRTFDSEPAAQTSNGDGGR